MASTSPLSVLLTDDASPTWTGVRLVLESSGFVIAGVAADADAAVALAGRLRPDICLLDAAIPGGGVETAARIKDLVPGTSVVLLDGDESDAVGLAAVRAGADGYLSARMDAARLAPALRGVRSGEAALSRRLVARLAAAYRAERVGAAAGFDALLTDREREILDHLLAGESTSQIAHALGLTDVTVRRHISGIIRKSGQRDRVAALRFARRERAADAASEDRVHAR